MTTRSDLYPTDGHFDRRSLHIVEQALVDFHRIDKMPDDSALLTEEFLSKPNGRWARRQSTTCVTFGITSLLTSTASS